MSRTRPPQQRAARSGVGKGNLVPFESLPPKTVAALRALASVIGDAVLDKLRNQGSDKAHMNLGRRNAQTKKVV